MKAYGYEMAGKWMGIIEDNRFIEFPTEGDYDEYIKDYNEEHEED